MTRKSKSAVAEKKAGSGIRTFSRTDILLIAGILLVTAIVFRKVVDNGFTDWDDDLYVVNSDLIRHLNGTSLISFFTTLTANLYTPIVTLSYAIDYQLYGLDASGFHLTSLIIHGINVVLIYILTFLLFRKRYLSIITALIFSLHPLNVEAVAWISSRKDLLFSMFYIAGLITYVFYLERNKRWLLAVVFLFFILSVFSKPVALTFPLALLIVDYFFHDRISWKDVLYKIPFLVVSIGFGILGIYLVREYDVFATAPVGYNIFDKICLAGYSLAFYIYNALLPLDISNYHAYPYKEGALLPVKYVAAPFAVLLLLFLVFKYARKNFVWVAGLLMFLIIIGPTLRLAPTGYPVAADRYFYLASVGLLWSLILLLNKVAGLSFPWRYGVVVVGSLFLIMCVVITSERVTDWKDSYSLWRSTLKNNPDHEIAHLHLGKLYDKAGEEMMALKHFQKIIERNKTNYDVLNSAANILDDNGQQELALTYYNMAIATGEANELPYYNRGNVYSSRNEFELAIKDFTEALHRKADFAEAYNNRGIAKVKSGDTLGAYEDFQQAVRLKPDDKMMQDNLARVEMLLNSR